MLKLNHFADDKTFYLDINPSTVPTSLNNYELAQVRTWINGNKLSLNVRKTVYMIISNRNQIEHMNISLSDQPIARTSNLKLLRVFIDDKLIFATHIDKLCSKVSQLIGVMRHISYLVPKDVLRNLYYTLIYSRLTYEITAWGSVLTFTTRRQLKMSSKLTQFKGVHDYFVLWKMFRIIRERKHVHFTQKTYNQLIPKNHKTRSRANNNLVLPRYSKSKYQNALIFRGIKYVIRLRMILNKQPTWLD